MMMKIMMMMMVMNMMIRRIGAHPYNRVVSFNYGNAFMLLYDTLQYIIVCLILDSEY